ncbi:MAG: beta-glucosidase [Clostridiaceae bacterium]|nr:beta-glucosidase [Clostridiaceae bacterium]
MSKVLFPKDFIWGTATAAYQIEGGFNEDGKGESIWDRFSHTPGKIHNRDTGDTACDHYHRYEEDIILMKQLGIQSYRYSISWPRIFPDGKGKINQKGLDFYLRLTDKLLENGIAPAVTLYHWDLPQKLQDIGGWTNREVTDYFTDYSEKIFSSLGDMVNIWFTHNEPWCAAFLGNMSGRHAPGIMDQETALKVSHNLLLSHGKTLKLYRNMNLKGKIGIALNLTPDYPASQNAEDINAAKLADGILNRWMLDPLLKASYPQDIVKHYIDQGINMEFTTGDLDIISQPMDFLAINYYTSDFVKHDPSKKVESLDKMLENIERTDMDWIVYPEGLFDLLMRLHNDYGKPDIIISENGAAFVDTLTQQGKIHDERRVNYLNTHLTQVHRAIEQGVNLKGFYLWSLLDNFEWNHGYSKKFGIVHVDLNTQKRTIKDSGYWYKNVIENMGF